MVLTLEYLILDVHSCVNRAEAHEQTARHCPLPTDRPGLGLRLWFFDTYGWACTPHSFGSFGIGDPFLVVIVHTRYVTTSLIRVGTSSYIYEYAYCIQVSGDPVA